MMRFHSNNVAGMGDHLQALSALTLLALKGETVCVSCIDMPWVPFYANWPAIRFEGVRDSCPGAELLFGCFFGRVKWYEAHGLDWQRKRMFNYVPERHRVFGEWIWGADRPRVLVQHCGTIREKTHSGMIGLSRRFRERGFNVIDLDDKGWFDHPTDARVMGSMRLLDLSGLCATADLFVGFDSGPLFLCLGSLVPSVSIVTLHRPDRIFLPLDRPEQMALFAQNAPEKIPIEDVEAESLRLLELQR